MNPSTLNRNRTMEATLRVLNQLEREGMLTRYAIGGAVGAIFYMEPFLTYDLDVFVALPATSGALLTLGRCTRRSAGAATARRANA